MNGVAPIPARDAVAFVSALHYSRSAAPGVARYGWVEDGRLLGVSIFDNGNHATRQGVFGPEYASSVFHHHRLAVHPDAPHGSTSGFLAASLRALAADRGALAVVTYADIDAGHVGTIYQATNAVYTGVTTRGNLYFRRPDGSVGTMQSLGGHRTWPERRAMARELGWEERRSAGKHRYVYLLKPPGVGRRRLPTLRWPALPYPRGRVSQSG